MKRPSYRYLINIKNKKFQKCLSLPKGFGALSGKMLLVRIVESNKIDAYFRAGWVN